MRSAMNAAIMVQKVVWEKRRGLTLIVHAFRNFQPIQYIGVTKFGAKTDITLQPMPSS